MTGREGLKGSQPKPGEILTNIPWRHQEHRLTIRTERTVRASHARDAEGVNTGLAERTIRKRIEQFVQPNEGQPYTYDRAAPIKMLDEALVTARSRTQ